MSKKYTEIHSLEKRKADYTKITSKYPYLIPLIIESNSRELVLPKNKYLVNHDTTVGSLIYTIQKMLNMTQSQASIFLHINNTLMATSSSFGKLYSEDKKTRFRDENYDGFLYCVISKENTFG